MNVLIISTAECTGGGAIAARRLLTALNNNGIQAKMLVRDKQTDNRQVVAIGGGSKWPKAVERLRLMLALRKPYKKTWNYDLAQDGLDILSTPEYREADVVHLHWVNQGMLSLDQLRQMLLSGKRIVWTLHDEWPFRGIKHYTGIGHDEDGTRAERLEAKHFALKQNIYRQGDIQFVGCSQWIANLAREAMPKACVHHVNNCVPQDLFQPLDKADSRTSLSLPQNEKLVLFTCQNVMDRRKGISFLIEALQYLPSPKPHLVIVGGGAETIKDKIKDFPEEAIHTFRYLGEKNGLVLLYSAVDCFVSPSLQDNLPNTIAEAMSCGTPCVGFDTGGIPEMITHLQDGYVAGYLDSRDLAQGIDYVLKHPELGEAAACAAARDYSEERTAREYARIYETQDNEIP